MKPPYGDPEMTLRDYFAANALVGMNASPELMHIVTSSAVGDGTCLERLARSAYRQADAMIKERKA